MDVKKLLEFYVKDTLIGQESLCHLFDQTGKFTTQMNLPFGRNGSKTLQGSEEKKQK